MQSRHSRGSIARVFVDIVVNGSGVVGLSPTVAIQRRDDGLWLQSSDGTWVPTKVENPTTEASVANLPGRYYFDFDQTLDTVSGSTQYIAVKSSSAGTLVLEYEDLEFGVLASSAKLNLCSVQGTVATPQGEASSNVRVRAVLVPMHSDSLARAVKSDSVVYTYTNGQGDFDLPLVRGATFRLEIDAIGYDRRVVIPDQASVLFTDL